MGLFRGTLTIDGKTYREESQHHYKVDAVRKAKVLRKRGASARVVFWGGQWTVFKRG